MAKRETGDSEDECREIRLVEADDGSWSAIDEATGVASQTDIRADTLGNPDEAVSLHSGEIGEPVTDADLRNLCIDSASVPDEPQEPDPL